MTYILPDVSHANLVNAMDENMFTVFDSFDNLPNVQWHDTPELKECVSDVAHPLFNIIMRARLNESNVEETVERIAKRARETGCGALWRVDNASTPDNLEDYLLKHGFQDAGDEPGMASNISDQRDKIKLSSGVQLHHMTDEAKIAPFITTLLKGFDMGMSIHEPMCDYWRAAGLQAESNFVHYYATLHGAMVATGTLFLGGGVAGIYNISTLEIARRRGIGEAITRQLMQIAFERGYRVAILQSSDMGRPIYERIGFRLIAPYRDYVYPQA